MTAKTNAGTSQQYDAVIIGAGISGISAAYHFQKNCPGKTYKIIERREQLGGTWDLFNYPGIRSDSDMYTFGYSFRPWSSKAAIAPKDKILEYLADTAAEYGIDQHMQYGVHVTRAAWSSDTARWQISAQDNNSGAPIEISAQYIFMCVGYYNYDQAHRPKFAGEENFNGQIVHPQFWPQDFDYTDKKMVVIGSGATAITLLPSLAEKAEHVTMLQRSPTYLGSKPSEDPMGNRIAKWFGHGIARWWFILSTMFLYIYCRAFPSQAKKLIIADVKKELGDKFEAKHFTPNYMPWDERVCLCPDSDFFEAMKSGKADIATDHIERFTENGIHLKSGEHLEADIIVTATGLEMLFFGGIEIEIDGQELQANQTFVYKGLMVSGAPNMFAATGYTNASWTLKVDLTNAYACRLINHLERKGYDYVKAEADAAMESAPLIDLTAGYVQRGLHSFPQQGTKTPWKLRQNYILDKLSLSFASVKDNYIQFHKKTG